MELFYQLYAIPNKYPVWKQSGTGRENYGFTDFIDKLDELAYLGVNKVWVSGALLSPRVDHGYDIQDYKKIDPDISYYSVFDLPDDFIEFIGKANSLGIEVLLDLVLNHTSTKHLWFIQHPEYYYWADEPKEWSCLFDGKSAFKYNETRKKYYVHLFHPEQADLAWFDQDGQLNQNLVSEFREIVKFWLRNGVKGFRLDVPQAMNKHLGMDKVGFPELLLGNDMAKSVINAVFEGIDCTLLMECFDPSPDGAILSGYLRDTSIQYGMNASFGMIESIDELTAAIKEYSKIPGFVNAVESHDWARFLSRFPSAGVEEECELLFNTAQNVMLYSGQEFGLKNPKLTEEMVRGLDAQDAMKMDSGIPFESLVKTSRANARVPVPKGEFKRQRGKNSSPLEMFKISIEIWRAGDLEYKE